MNSIDERLRALERDFQHSRRTNRVLIIAIVAMLCVAGAQVATPQTSKPKTPEAVPSTDVSRQDDRAPLGKDRMRSIEAEQIVLLDRSGRSRIRLTITEGGPELSMLDENGQTRLRLGCSLDSTGLELLDTDDSPSLSLRQRSDSGSTHLEIRSPKGSSLIKADGLSIRDASNRGRLQLALLNGTFPVLGIGQSDQGGPPLIEMTSSEGSRSLKIHDDNGHALFSVFADNSGNSRVSMRHPNHERSLELSTAPEELDGPMIAFVAPAKADGSGGQLPFLQFGLHKDSQPYIRMVDTDGRTRFAAPVD